MKEKQEFIWIVEGYCVNCETIITTSHRDRDAAIYILVNAGCKKSVGHNFKVQVNDNGGRYMFASRKESPPDNPDEWEGMGML